MDIPKKGIVSVCGVDVCCICHFSLIRDTEQVSSPPRPGHVGRENEAVNFNFQVGVKIVLK